MEHSVTLRLACQIALIASLLLPTACADPGEPIASASFDAVTKTDDWPALLEALYNDPGVIVEQGGSIQAALDAANEGAVIYVEPGSYAEEITIGKSGIRLIGATNGDTESVVIGKVGNERPDITLAGEGSDAILINLKYQDVNDRRSLRSMLKSGKHREKLEVSRTEMGGDIVHYSFNLRVGDRPFDVVRIHRVVQERRAFKPVGTEGAVFMLHGAALNFESIFIKAGADQVRSQTSAAVYLAKNKIDVWGMDFAWTMVPAETNDFSFMADWGVERDMDHALAAVSVARLIRGLSGQGFGKMNVLGFSYGAVVAYAAAGRETQQHPILRDLSGVVAVDQVLKFDETHDAYRQLACAAAAVALEDLQNGVYHSTGGVTFRNLADLAINAPDDPSPLNPMLNNYQTALFVGSSTFLLPNPATPFWHFVGGDFSGGTFPVPSGLLYTEPSRWIGLLGSLPPYQPQRTSYEARACACDEVEVSIDDHLSEISVPILYLGAAGGFGTLGNHTSSLTSSDDITHHTVSLQPEGEIVSDFGHGDIFLANDAPELVWSVLREWLSNHNKRPFM